MTTATVPAPIASAPSLKAADLAPVIDAMRSIQTEDDRWTLAEALATVLPAGDNGQFQKIIDQATSDQVAGKLKVHTLRQYRDTANRWPAAKRVKNVSFTAHREAMALESIDEAVKLLKDMVAMHGIAGVSAGNVRRAVQLKKNPQGKPATAAAPAAGTTKVVDTLADIRNGGQTIIQGIPGTTGLTELDELKGGLNKILQHVERLHAKATQKAAAKASPASTPAPAAAAPAAPAVEGNGTPEAQPERKAGDLRRKA